MKLRPTVYALVVLSLALPLPAGALNVPLTVSEGLTANISGMARTAEPVSVGIPLPEASGITSVSQLGLSGATAGQFRSLATWPNGNIKWVLVDFQATVPANGVSSGVTLVDGGGAFGGGNLGADAGSSITVDTGAARFTVPKANFNFFSQVVVNGQSFLRSGGAGLFVRGPTGVLYSSANDASSTATIEEDGPVRCVVRSTGRLMSSTGSRLMDYTVRLYFYKGKAYAKAFVSMRNASSSATSVVTMTSAGVALPLQLGASPSFSFGRAGSSPVSGTLASTETAYLLQGVTTINGGDTYAWPTPPMKKVGSGSFDYEQKGLLIGKGSTILNPLSTIDAIPATGWGSLSDNTGKGVVVAHRWMASYWPCGFELQGDGTADVEIFSKRNTLPSFTFAWGAYETREMLFEFHTAAGNGDAALYALQYPLLARAPLSQYADCGAFSGETKLVTPAQEQSWFASHGATAPSLGNIQQEIYRYYQWPKGGGANQVDQAFLHLIDFVRTGYGGYYASGEQETVFKNDSAVRHSDGFDLSASYVHPSNGGSFNQEPFDFAHAHVLSLPLYYYMSGNELVRGGITDLGEFYDAETSGRNGSYAPQTQLGDADMRSWSRTLRNFAVLEECTGNTKYRQIVQNMLNQLLNSSDVPPNCTPFGRNRGRGYVWMLHSSACPQRMISDFFTVQIHAEAIWEARRLLLRYGLPRVEETEDLLLGLADFAYSEMYFELNGGTTLMNYGYLYDFYLDVANNGTTNPASYKVGELRPVSTGRLFGFAYQMTGQTRYLTREAKLLPGDTQYISPRTPSDPKSQFFMYEDLNRGEGGWQRVTDATATNQGSGTWLVRWTAPSGARGYKVRYADKPIVESLGFDQATFTYRFSPSSYTPLYAANHVSNEPSPSAGGAAEQLSVSGLDPTKTYSFYVQYVGGPASTDLIAPSAVGNLRAR